MLYLKTARRLYIFFLISVLASLCPAAAEDFKTAANSPAAKITGRIETLMTEENIAGAAVFIVKNGAHVYSRAFGFADTGNKIKFTFDKTVFPAGSLSKVITALGVLKLVENGALNLKTPAADYFANSDLPETVSIASLITHSSGLANCSKLYASNQNAAVKTPRMKNFIEKNFPRFDARAVNVKFEYSNFNYALLGHIIETTVDKNFDDYIKTALLDALSMRYSSFDRDYFFKNSAGERYEVFFAAPGGSVSYDACEGAGFKRHNMPPASGLITCAADISGLACFLTSLNALTSNKTKDASLARAAARLFEKALPVKKGAAPVLDKFPEIDFMTYGLRHSLYKSHSIFWHTGSVKGFSCGLYIAAENGLAFFTAYNSSNAKFRQRLVKYLFDEFFAAGK
ncbi:MAG TPA: serine hydrolase domain-containing protein [Candidatus Wallbacteria bacterium]|nr:serine hydrolase domain-containing protein [Candidatus Wallbacteria bacterium]